VGDVSFEARYPGQCSKCDEAIEPGQVIQRLQGKLYGHVTCPEVPQGRVGEVCTKCFQEKAKNGSCGCDDVV